jgi:molybdopterin/thiamine biosynthesis adenylyltransferase
MSIPVYIMVGAGGTGSILYQPLMRFLRTHHGPETYLVAVIDGDHVEEKNLARQLFPSNEVSNNKAAALVQQTADKEGRAVAEFLGDDNIEHRVREGDTVLICADNFDVRQRIERHAMTLENVTIINGGNELLDGSVQIFARRAGKNVTPALSWQHPEILRTSPYDPTKLSCLQRAEIPGGEQTIIANMMSATLILNALRRVLANDTDVLTGLDHEVYFDLQTERMRSSTTRDSSGQWHSYDPYAEAVLV